ncbi:hypothetical protein RSOLAG22IIIB_10007 [Rhizoctonia solani]|uniref:F-box domain-containing protein n=1 Tax=Rhizoctonia solani TaxID=456999 RepID=A0A0K6G1C2_9AGAM|nr:hypothetical protein RSOLAG22IIIB_10007 [Rhizoctonia solani]
MQAQDALDATRGTKSIQDLPPEILLNIFPLVVKTNLASFIAVNLPLRISPSPRTITSLNHPLNPGLFARAKVLAVRAGDIPLEIHICDPYILRLTRRTLSPSDYPLRESFNTTSSGNPEYSEESEEEEEDDDDDDEPEETQDTESEPELDLSTMSDFKFLPSSPTLIKSLELDLVAREDHNPACHTAALAYFLDNCTPEVFVSYSSQQFHRYVTGLPTTKHERVWRQAKILRLNGMYPGFDSPAFHGLIELRIGHMIPWPTESVVLNALKSSPKLRILHLNMTPPELPDNSNEPNEFVYLEDLEEIEVNGQFSDTVVKWVVPGAKPLQLSVRDVPYDGHTLGFYERANTTRLFIDGFSVLDFLTAIARLPRQHRLEVLAVKPSYRDCRNFHNFIHSDDEQELNQPARALQIDTLYLLDFKNLRIPDVEQAVHKYSVRRLIIRGSSLNLEDGISEQTQRSTRTFNRQRIQSELSKISPLLVVRYLEYHSPLSLEWWN